LKIPDKNQTEENFDNSHFKNEEKIENINSNYSSNSNSSLDFSQINSFNIENSVYREGYLYKITYSNKLKKLFFKLTGKDFYCNIIYQKIIRMKYLLIIFK